MYHLIKFPTATKLVTVAELQKVCAEAVGAAGILPFPITKFPKPVIPEAVAVFEVKVPEFVEVDHIAFSYLRTM